MVLEWLENINFRLESKGDLKDGRFLKANGIGGMTYMMVGGCWARFCDILTAEVKFGLVRLKRWKGEVLIGNFDDCQGLKGYAASSNFIITNVKC